ncbi:MAG: hypothetical protein HYX87_04575 [Chloroflexi bacterium]|nr:hypothetical protein [Chloroflexota bacterium]
MAENGTKRFYCPHFVGLGGTGAEILASLMRNKNLVLPLLKTEGVRISCMALDVADGEVRTLLSAYDELKKELRLRNIPSEKILLTTKLLKFNTPQVMFDAVQEYPEYLKREGCRIPTDYKPWLTSAMDIPPLAGGVGRRRALAKGIYALNYHLLGNVNESIISFKEHMVGSTWQPIVFVIYGMGGGSGGGMALDFVRHLRKQLGSGVPVIGITILPCPGDDPPAKGASAFVSLLEHSLLLDRAGNNMVVNEFGSCYQTPFNAFFMMPLGPAWGQGKGILYARQIIDDAIGDTLVNCMNFDLADLLAHIGTNVDLEGKWINTLSTVSLSYPVEEHVNLTKSYLDKLDKIRILQKQKREIFGGAGVSETGGVKRLLEACRGELTDIYRRWLTQRGRYDPEKFPEAVRALIYEDRSVDSDYVVYLRSVHESIQAHLDELFQSVKAVGLDAAEGTLEARIRKLMLEFYELTSELPRKPHEFEARVPEIVAGLPEDLLTAHHLTPRQVELLRDVLDLALLIQDYIAGLRAYLEIHKLADRLHRMVEASAQGEDSQKALELIRRISSPELVVLFSFISALHRPLEAELKSLDEHLTNCRRMRRLLAEEERDAESLCQGIEDQRLSAEAEKKRVVREIGQLRPLLSPPGKKKALMAKQDEINQRLQLLDQQLENYRVDLLKVQSKIKEYATIERKYEVGSEYRALIVEIIEMSSQYYEKLSELGRDRGFYDRTADMTESERLKIMQVILKGDERALSRENMLNEIVDRDHLRRSLVSVINLFRMPETLGLTSDYKTDFIWFTVSAPPGIWSKDLEHDITTALSGYVREDVNRSVYLRHIESADPWKVRFLAVAAKAWPGCLDLYKSMKHDYESANLDVRQRSHSFLLEQGRVVKDTDGGRAVALGLFDDMAMKAGDNRP